MLGVSPVPLPENALLARYRVGGNYTDCWSTLLKGKVTHARYVEAFYTTWIFKVERFILRWLVNRPSTDAQAAQLAAGEGREFAAWFVEDRAVDQLLLSDFRQQTRSWLMVAPEGGGTRLFFGSALVAGRSGSPGLAARALTGFHKLYSIVLLAAAAKGAE